MVPDQDSEKEAIHVLASFLMTLNHATGKIAQNGQAGTNGLIAVLHASEGLDHVQDLALMVLLAKMDALVLLVILKIALEAVAHGMFGVHGAPALRPVLVVFVAEIETTPVVWNQKLMLKHVTQIRDLSAHGNHGQHVP